jgi:hypothetical protein
MLKTPALLILVIALAFLVIAAFPLPGRNMPPPLISTTSQEVTSVQPASSTIATTTQATTGPTANVLGENHSSLHLDSGGSPILLIDPEGRKTGYDAATGRILEGIPNSNFNSEALQDIENTSSSAPVDYLIDVDQPSDGTYGLVLAGSKSGDSYDLTMVTFSRDGNRQSSAELKGSMISGTEKMFQINFVSAPNGSSTIDVTD